MGPGDQEAGRAHEPPEGEDVVRSDLLPTAGGWEAPARDEAGSGKGAPSSGRRAWMLEIPGYEIVGSTPIASGGMGEVWQARRLADGRAVAIKIGRPGAPVEYFLREIECLRGLDHPNIVKYFAHGMYESGPGRAPYLVMEYVFDARPITRYAWENRLGVRARLELFLQACAAVGCLHRGGSRGDGRIHRDLKPDNIQVGGGRPRTGEKGDVNWPTGRVKLIDLGIAAPVDLDAAVFERALEQGDVGSMEYMAPEQFRPGLLDERTDVYALGVVLHELLTGTLPYPTSKQVRPAVRSSIMNHEITGPARAAREMMARVGDDPGSIQPVPCEGELEAVVLRALAYGRGERFVSVDAGAGDLDFAVNIRALLDSRPAPCIGGVWYRARKTARRHLRRPVAWLAALLLAVGFGWMAPRWIFDAAQGWQSRWERWVITSSPSGFARAPVLVVTYGDNTDYDLLARWAGLPAAGDPASMRRVLGRLMEDVARGRPGGVLIDKTYLTGTEEDAAFAAGVRALHAVDRTVCVVANQWFGRSVESAERDVGFAGVAAWGVAMMGHRPDRPWQLYAAQTGPDGEVWPSLAAVAAAFYKRGPAPATWSFDDRGDALVARIGDGAESETVRLPLTGVMGSGSLSPEFNLAPETPVGYYTLRVPSQAALDSKSIDLGELVAMTEINRLALVRNRVIVIGDTRNNADTHAYLDGRKIPGVVAHATAVSQMLMRRAVRMPSSRAWELIRLTASAAAGLAAGWAGAAWWRRLTGPARDSAGRGRAVARIGAPFAAALPLAAVLTVIALISWGWFVSAGMMYPPLVCMITAAAAAMLAIPIAVSRRHLAWEAGAGPGSAPGLRTERRAGRGRPARRPATPQGGQ